MRVDKQLIYLLYGDRKLYEFEAKFSILTALARRRSDSGPVIRVLTERPAAFDGWPVEVVKLDAATLQAWTGPSGYNHRRKACAIAAAAQWADKTVFIDTDTFFLCDPDALFEKVGPQRYLVDTFEWTWKDALRRPDYAMFTAGIVESGQQPGDAFRFYNSGLCGLSRDDAHLMERVIQRIDDWSRFTSGLHTIEQIALSFELDGRQVSEGRGQIEHYFAHKEYFHAMLGVFFERYGEAFDPALLTLCEEVPRERPMPSPFERLRIKWRLKGVSPALKKAARKLLYGSAMQGDDYVRACKWAWWSAAISDLREVGLFDLTGAWPQEVPSPGGITELEFRMFAQRFLPTDQTPLSRQPARAIAELIGS
ncbi:MULTISPECIES: hypothetical protein [Pseudomonas]|jgi:hypothetical protein|uniref:Uncharacterized protein n=1 Tax=Pseudomonas citronellolis TaxID=53408 RepID=A0A1A9KI51_9PSED|nr:MULTISPECIES: hypothetical protein [Pseudomonas]ANI17174.1 hypothetical protein A9C11_25735 [Pseudomonas citronellolis]KES20829.1 hypothetical protein FG99_28355 [Pseudomonas sp. AAC]MBH3433708.1 hypothetical protein [Pseudomonas citronellolis]